MKLNIIMALVLLSYMWLYTVSKRVVEILDEQNTKSWELDKRERDREIMERHMEELSEQLLEFVFDTSKVAKLPVGVEFDDVTRTMLWTIHRDDGISVKVKGLEYEVDEYVVIKGETQEILLKVLGIDKTDEVNKTTVLRCDYVSSREKKNRHSYMDLYNMFYILQEDLDNVKQTTLSQSSMRQREIENLEKEFKGLDKKLKALLERDTEISQAVYEIEKEHAKEIAKLEDRVNKLTKEAGNGEGNEVHVKVDISEEDIEEIVKKTTNNINKTLQR